MNAVIAEIITEARRLDEAVQKQRRLGDFAGENFATMSRDGFYVQHFPLLVAVAEAAVEKHAADAAWRDVFRRNAPVAEVAAADERQRAADLAFDAALRGEGKTP